METRGSTEIRQSVQIKICGLRQEEDIRIVNEVMPEYAGFILAEGRKRTVTPQRMAELTEGLDSRIQRVAVFLDQDPEWICTLAEQDLMDVIQLHGTESDEMIRMLRKRTGKTVIKALRVDESGKAGLAIPGTTSMTQPGTTSATQPGTPQIETPGSSSIQLAERVQGCAADLVLLDHGNGGSGERFDWSITDGISRPFILAGGLTPENVQEAIERTHPMAVDVSSGVETDSLKDVNKVRRFVWRVRKTIYRSSSI